MASELKVNKISPESGTTLTLGDSGDTINFGSGVLPNFENLTVTGDLTVDTNSLKVDSTNNFVGIGTATPAVALDVVGAITATGNITGTLATASQPNITSVGTLSSLSVSGNITGTLATAAQPNITSLGTLTGLTTTGNINLGDNDKAQFGASNDLAIYHTGTDSIIEDVGTGELEIRSNGTGILLQKDTTEYLARFLTDGASELYYDNSKKLATTSTGIDVTGTITSDGLTVDGGGSFTQAGGGLKVLNNGTAGYNANIFFGIPNQTDGWSIGQGITANDGVFRLYDNGAGQARMAVTTGGDISFYEDTGTTAKFFWDASTESLGIGTSAPTYPLSISSSYKGIQINDGTSTLTIESNTAGQWTNVVSGNNKWNVYTNGLQRLVVDGSGNVGIGTSSPLYQFDVGNGSGSKSINIFSGSTSIGALYFTDSTSGTGSYIGRVAYDHSSDAMLFTTNTSERMRIDSSGNVGIGTSSPDAKLHIHGPDQATANIDTSSNIVLNVAGTGITPNSGGSVVFSAADGAWKFAAIKGLVTDGANNTRGDLVFSVRNATANSTLSEAMRINSSGNVGIGTTNTSLFNNAGGSSKLVVTGSNSTTSVISNTGSSIAICNSDTTTNNNAGLHFCFASTQNFAGASIVGILGTKVSGQYPAGQLAFLTSTATNSAPTEKMRIDSSGDVLLNTTSAVGAEKLSVHFDRTSEWGITIKNTSATSPSNATLMQFYYASTQVGGINSTGSSTTFNTTSDYRVKENVVEMTGATERLKQLQPKRFNFITDADTTVDGFLAHEVSTVVPEAITGTKDEVDADGNPVYQGIDQSKLVPLLTASLQEALVEIDNLKARIEVLENV